MSNVIPPLLSDSPPPMVNGLEDDEDDFGDFTSAPDILYNYDDLSLPTTPQHAKQVETKDVNSNTDNVESYTTDKTFIPNTLHMDKDFQDKRKNSNDSLKICETEVNFKEMSVNSVNVDDAETSTVKLEVTFVPIELDKVDNDTANRDIDICPVPEISNGFPNCQLPSRIISDNIIPTVDNIVNDCKDNDTDDFYYCEEPPDLNTVDDSKLNVDDFNYNAYNSEEEFDEIYNSVSQVDDVQKEISNVAKTERKNGDINEIESSQSDDIQEYTSTIDKNELAVENSLKTNEEIIVEVIESNDDTKNIDVFDDYSAGDDYIEKDLTLNDSSIALSEEVTDSQNLSGDFNNFSVDDDDFGDFVTPNEEIIEKDQDDLDKTPNPENDDSIPVQIDDDDFGDFAEPQDDDFGAFADFTQTTFPEPKFETADDNFGNFDDFTQTFDAAPTRVDEEDIYAHAEKILSEMFPPFGIECKDCSVVDRLSNNSVFNKIKSVTETHALQYQWAKSASQEKLLGSLNIDTRNILYGPGWNPMMPKFAANLGVAPLEPVKSDILIPTPVHNVSSNVSAPAQPTHFGTIPTEIPTAQFDWSGSGLVNPLDSLPQETQEKISDRLSTGDQVDHTSELQTSEDRSPKQSDTESVKSLQLSSHEETVSKADPNTATAEEFDDFTSYQPSNSWPINSVPLRETHISSDVVPEPKKSDVFDLKPRVEEISKKVSNDDDEFTDFQIGLPSNNVSAINPAPVLVPLKPMVVPQEVRNAPPAQILWPDPGITGDDILNIELNYSRKSSLEKIEVKNVVEAPREKKLVEVTKTTAQKNTGFSNLLKSKFVTKNTDGFGGFSGDIKKRTDFKIPMNNLSMGDHKNIGKVPQTTVDDEWSDFICNPEPIKSNKFPERERTNTPELQLSINHLSQLQPPKQPIPVITPHGLIQTKIPSNSNLINYQTLHQNPNHNRGSYQPSIISQQYQNHINGPTFTKLPQNTFPAHVSTLHKNIESNNDDDDWTEFVSSAPASQNRNPKSNGWSNSVMPNIITNPVHSFGSYMPAAGNSRTNRRNVVPSISSMPELEFSAPKGKGFVKK